MKKFLVLLIIFLSILFLEENAYAEGFDVTVIDWAIGQLCGHITGHLGALLVTVAAFGALVSAALGSFRVFYSAIITAVGSYAVASIMSLYFEDASTACLNGFAAGGITNNGGGNGNTDGSGGGSNGVNNDGGGNGNGDGGDGNAGDDGGNGNGADGSPRLATPKLQGGNPNLNNNSTILYEEKNQKIDPFLALD